MIRIRCIKGMIYDEVVVLQGEEFVQCEEYDFGKEDTEFCGDTEGSWNYESSFHFSPAALANHFEVA